LSCHSSFSDLSARVLVATTAIAFSAFAFSRYAQAQDSHPVSLADLSIEELARLPVTSVSRRPSPVSTAAASIYVITGEDIRRSGATSLPEALRLAPNLQVARVDARNYAISARGFNNSIANKMLVLIDGRTIYSPLFSGVFWGSHDVVLEDVERIEVVSGPGSTLWGANAVNGVISITTKSAGATHGGLVALGGSMEERQVVARYGGQVGEEGHFRVYAKHHHHDDVLSADGNASGSGLHRTLAGFRSDWQGDKRHLTVQGDVLRGRLQQPNLDDVDVTGANLLARLKQPLENSGEALAQVYLDYYHRYQPGSFDERLNTLDIDLQHGLRVGRRHNLIWGGGYRYADDDLTSGTAYAILPPRKAMNWANLFAQNDIGLFDAVHLTMGVKFEHNSYTGWESLPNIRLSYAPRRASYLLWGALSRSVRSPSRLDSDLYTPGQPDLVAGQPDYRHWGNPNFQSEIAEVAEFGYRAQPLDNLSFSTTLFFSRYDRLRTLERDTNGDTRFGNFAEAEAYGLEFWGGWQVTDHWRLSAGFVAQEIDLDVQPYSTDSSSAVASSNRDPEVYWQLRSSLALTDSLEVEAFFRRVGALGAMTATPAYSTLDLRCGWRLGPGLELSLVGQNLLDDTHPEFGSAPTYNEYRRALYVKVLWEL
jgi:iron complex outermembrane receptor protein